MQHIDVSKKRKARWPWLLGVGLLVLVLWGVTILLRPDPEPEPEAAVVTAADTLPPAMIPSGSGGARPAGESGSEALTGERVGERVRVEGQVVATGADMFWLRTGSRVLLVESPRRAAEGESLSIEGTLRDADAATTDRLAARAISDHPESGGWTVLRSVKLVEGQDSAAAGADGD